MAIREIIIFTEDTYGVEFFNNLIQMISKRYKTQLKVTLHRLAGKCYPKVNRQITAACNSTKNGIVLIIADAEGENVQSVERFLLRYVPKTCPIPVRLLIFQYMIEEWICVGLSIKYSSDLIRRLDEYLRNMRGPNYKYKKRILPDFVERLDMNKLEQHSLFVKFLNILLDRD